jgi:hypothetical protein
MKPSLERRLVVLESKTGPNIPVDWRERLARYKMWFVDGKREEPQTDEEKANLARYKRYFDELEAGVAAPRWDQW